MLIKIHIVNIQYYVYLSIYGCSVLGELPLFFGVGCGKLLNHKKVKKQC